MNNTEQLQRRIIELIHGLPYKKAIEKEPYHGRPVSEYVSSPITIGRVMQAINNKTFRYSTILYFEKEDIYEELDGWQLTKDNGQEATIEDQSDKTVNTLLSLLK